MACLIGYMKVIVNCTYKAQQIIILINFYNASYLSKFIYTFIYLRAISKYVPKTQFTLNIISYLISTNQNTNSVVTFEVELDSGLPELEFQFYHFTFSNDNFSEEVFGEKKVIWFSSNGSKIAYATFDDTDVRIMKIPHYGVPGSVESQYTSHRDIRYPKVCISLFFMRLNK